MFLSREIDIKLRSNYTKIHKYAILYKSCSIKQIISTNTQPIRKGHYPTEAWESQVCWFYIFLNFYFAFLFDIIYNIITYSPYSPYFVTRPSSNGSALYWSRDFRLYDVTKILHCQWLKLRCLNVYMYRLTPDIIRVHHIPPFIFPLQSL